MLFLEGVTYWSVLVPYGPWKTVVEEFHRTFCFDLTIAGARPEIVGEFESWGASTVVQPYLDKRALGVWRELAYFAQVEFQATGDPQRAQAWMRRCPISPLKVDISPNRALVRVLAEG